MELIKFKSLRMNFNLISLLIIFSIVAKMANAGTVLTPLSASRNNFAADIFQKIATGKPENVIFSPASIHTCLGMAFFATGGKTAEEMRRVLKFGNVNRDQIANNFEEFVKNTFKNSREQNAVQLNMANRIYVNENLQIKSEFNEIAKKSFQSKAEQVNFADSANAVRKINNFIEDQTQHKIQNVLQQGSVDSDTSVVLVNAIYFKGKWEIPFSASWTSKRDFTDLGNNKIPVDTMHMEERVRYGEFPKLDAKVIELSYANSDISMLVFLPNAVNGLESMEKKLAGKNLNEILSKLQYHEVVISMPKFRIEYDIDLKQPLKELGLQNIFTNNADFSELLENATQQKISEVKHKAFIDVNEAGSEAAAATVVKITLMSANFNQKHFNADHPFAFAIRDSTAVYFAGHVVKI